MCAPRSGEMFSSCAPCSAFVEGVKRGVRNFSDSRRPSGSGIPCTVRDFLYSGHAEPIEAWSHPASSSVEYLPVRYPRTIASSGKTSAFLTRMERPSSCCLCCCTSSGISSILEVMTWFEMMCSSLSNQKSDSSVRTRPLSGIPFPMKEEANHRIRNTKCEEEITHIFKDDVVGRYAIGCDKEKVVQ
jgi:hypothetical protein